MRRMITLGLLMITGTALLVLPVRGADRIGDYDQQPQTPSKAAGQAQAPPAKPKKKPEFPKFEDVAEGYRKVVSSVGAPRSLYTIWTREKDAQMLAELPRNHEGQKLFIAYTVAGGVRRSGVQVGDMYGYWRRYDKRLALIEPNYEVRTTGDLESKKGAERVFTDRVILDVPILTIGPGGGPVIDMDALLVGQAGRFFGYAVRGANTRLAKIAKAKAFPQNVELAFEMPLSGGRFGTLHYSISVLPNDKGYKPRKADDRIGYFTTTHRDIGHPGADTPWVRYINRWKLEKADPKLKMSPPKEPIVFYLEHTIPVRYRRWVRDGLLEWNKAFEKIGIVNAIEVYQQDARTGMHMEKDPEDARYNFILWTNANMGFAIGPSRVDPRTGQILDADIVLDEGFITSWVNAWRKLIPEVAMQNFGPETLAWLQTRPQWDPRVRLAPPSERSDRMRELAMNACADCGHDFAGHPVGRVDATLMGDDEYDGLAGRVSQINGHCNCAMMKTLDLALFRMAPELLDELAIKGAAIAKEEEDDENGNGEAKDEEKENGEKEEDEKDEQKAQEQKLDGVPEWFIGPLLRDVTMHEVGHTLGLRHNFKASSIYSLEQINSDDFEGKAICGSIMEYLPLNINFGDGETQGEYGMVTIGPYDYWAIEYGYTLEEDLDPILARVSEPELTFATDEDAWGVDPLARTFDLGKDSLNYAESQMRLINHLRGKILARMVKDGDSWAKARQGYEMLLGKHMAAVSIAANWLGGADVNRDHKGDPGDRDPVTPVSVYQQRRAIEFVIDNMFRDEAFGLTPDLLAKMTIERWWDGGGYGRIFDEPAWPVHDRILSMQAAALTMLMNPTTLNRVYDNEFRTPAGKDAVTLPELVYGTSEAVWAELDEELDADYTARKPMISSLRRNLQREHLERLIDLTLPNGALGAAAKPVANLGTHELRELQAKIEAVLDDGAGRIDPYTVAHLSEAEVRIEKALDAQYIYNTDDISAGSGSFPFIFFQPREDEQPDPR
ncbi:MAG: zinc-dependent metalloprotease [Planctomycetota bacterium]|nr:zinc-dependent metalloprotease [Planctomycetota bacterium]